MSAPDRIFADVGGQCLSAAWGDWSTEATGAEYVRADIAADLLAALEAARETIIQLVNSRWSEAEGTDADWVAEIDAAIARARGAA